MSKIIIFIIKFIGGILVSILAWYGISLVLFGLVFILFDSTGWTFALLSLMIILNLAFIPLLFCIIRAYALWKKKQVIKGFNCGYLVGMLMTASYIGYMVLEMLNHHIVKPI